MPICILFHIPAPRYGHIVTRDGFSLGGLVYTIKIGIPNMFSGFDEVKRGINTIEENYSIHSRSIFRVVLGVFRAAMVVYRAVLIGYRLLLMVYRPVKVVLRVVQVVYRTVLLDFLVVVVSQCGL